MCVRSIVKGSIPRDGIFLVLAQRRPASPIRAEPRRSARRGGAAGSGSVLTIRRTPFAVNPGRRMVNRLIQSNPIQIQSEPIGRNAGGRQEHCWLTREQPALPGNGPSARSPSARKPGCPSPSSTAPRPEVKPRRPDTARQDHDHNQEPIPQDRVVQAPPIDRLIGRACLVLLDVLATAQALPRSFARARRRADRLILSAPSYAARRRRRAPA